jgi:hypothetical protein
MSIPKPHELPALDPEEFKGIFGFAMRAAGREIDSPHPPDHGINLQSDDGTINRISLKDNPMNRAGLALVQEYGADHDLFQNIMFRIGAFTAALEEAPMQKWKKPDPENPKRSLLHSAAIEAAALMPLKSDGFFDADKLDQKTREIADRKYSNLR